MIPWWTIPIAVFFGYMLAGLMRQASRADDCLECRWRKEGMSTQKPLADLDEEHNLEVSNG